MAHSSLMYTAQLTTADLETFVQSSPNHPFAQSETLGYVQTAIDVDENIAFMTRFVRDLKSGKTWGELTSGDLRFDAIRDYLGNAQVRFLAGDGTQATEPWHVTRADLDLANTNGQ